MTFLRRAVPAAVLAAAAALLTGSPAGASVDAGAVAGAGGATGTTKLTVRVVGCEECVISLTSFSRSGHGEATSWSAAPREVRDGRVTVRMLTGTTPGLQVAVSAPWEGATGYTSLAALRYAGQRTGDEVSFREAREQRRASRCWAGTTAAEATLRIKVRRVTVEGTQGPTPGVMAWAPRTQQWLAPMERVHRGVLGAQDVALCG